MATETIKIEKVTCDVCGKEIKDPQSECRNRYDRHGKGTIEGFDLKVTKYVIVGLDKTIENPDICEDCFCKILKGYHEVLSKYLQTKKNKEEFERINAGMDPEFGGEYV